jgi:hypothetical protein
MRTRAKYAIAGALAALLALPLAPAFASSHREAPGITEAPKVDGTDFYMFRSYETGRDQFVTILANYQPLQAPYGGPNYFTMDPDAIYEIHIDNNGDALEDLTYQFKFTNTLSQAGAGISLNIGGKMVAIPLRAANQVTAIGDTDLNEVESYTLTQISGDRRTGTRTPVTNMTGGATSFGKPLDNVGNKTIPNYANYAGAFVHTINLPNCTTPGRVFVGQRAEAFAVNLGEIFDLVNIVPVQRGFGGGFADGKLQDRANDDVVGESNVTTIALELPISCITRANTPVIGGWTTASLPQAQINDPTPTYAANNLHGGAYVQMSRLSNPLVNELVIGIKDKNAFNASEPVQDRALFADYVTNPTLPALLNALFLDAVNARRPAGSPAFTNLAPNNFPRNDLVAAFLTGVAGVNQPTGVVPAEMIRLNTTTAPKAAGAQNTLGVIGGDTAGFPNGRRPGDDVVDIALDVVMGRLCHAGLGLCDPANAPTGLVPFTDGAPITATELQSVFPYLNDPIPGSPNDPPA